MLDPRIGLLAEDANFSKSFNNVLTNIGNIDAIKQRRRLNPLKEALLKTQVGQNQTVELDERTKSRMTSLSNFAQDVLPDLRSDNPQGALQKANNRLARIRQTIADNPGIQLDTTEVEQFINLLQTPEGQLRATELAEQALQIGQQQGLLGKRTQSSASQREFENNLRIAQDPNSTDIERNSALVNLRQRAPVRDSSEERILDSPDLTEKAIDLEGGKAGAKEKAKLTQQLKFKPQIEKAVTLARSDAAGKGETFNLLKKSEAALPGLENAVVQLKELAPFATSTLGGRVFDSVLKETGFGSTKGANARVKFTSIINNQVLPLLKQTFGAAFTEKEGETLKATMGDVNATPEQKMLTLDAFIDQKKRDIISLQNELDNGGSLEEWTQRHDNPEPDFGGFKIISVE